MFDGASNHAPGITLAPPWVRSEGLEEGGWFPPAIPRWGCLTGEDELSSLSQPRTLNLGNWCWRIICALDSIDGAPPPTPSSSSIESFIRNGEKHILGESTLTWGEDIEECGDLPLAGEKVSPSPSSPTTIEPPRALRQL